MSGQIQDSDWTIPAQDGAKKLSLPWQEMGQPYATQTDRNLSILSSYYDPIMEQRTTYANLLLYSDDMTQAAWSKTHTTATAASTDPEGGTSASKLVEDNTNNAHNASQAMTVASGAISYGIFAQAGERSFVRVRINNGTDGDVAKAVFNLSTGTILSGTGTIKKLLNGWFWCYVGGTATVSNSSAFVDLSSDGSTFSYAGTTGSGVYLWHATSITTIPTTPWPAILTTSATRSVITPPVDPDDPISYLVAETSPSDAELLFGIARWTRTYARVSRDLNIGTSIGVAKPNVPGVLVNYRTYIANTGAPTLDLSTATTANIEFNSQYFCDFSNLISYNIYGPWVACTGTTVNTASGGTFILTYKTSSTAAIAYNDSNVNIAAAVNGLASIVADGITVTANNQLASGNPSLILTASAGTWLAAMSINGASITPANAGVFDLEWTVAASTQMQFQTRLSISATAHGITTGAAIVVFGSSIWQRVPNGSFSVPDANTILVPEVITGTKTQVARFTRVYVPGTAICPATSTTSFYLPGVSPGVVTFSDIPIPTFQGDTLNLLTKIFSSTGSINYVVGTLSPWNEPIYQIGKIVIQASQIG